MHALLLLLHVRRMLLLPISRGSLLLLIRRLVKHRWRTLLLLLLGRTKAQVGNTGDDARNVTAHLLLLRIRRWRTELLLLRLTLLRLERRSFVPTLRRRLRGLLLLLLLRTTTIRIERIHTYLLLLLLLLRRRRGQIHIVRRRRHRLLLLLKLLRLLRSMLLYLL